ncbi:MAG: DUF2284 domain-containing protein [Nitrospinaceae bacterium]
MFPKISNVKKIPQGVCDNQEFIEEALGLGCTKAKVIQTRTIALGPSGRLQCQYGCSHYGKCLTCPPYSPTSEETSEMLYDYQKALLIHGDSGADMREIAVSLENSFKKKGFYKAFGMSSRSCDLCDVCTVETGCKYPDKARPSMHACGIDVPQTISNNGWVEPRPLAPCSEEQNIGMVLID